MKAASAASRSNVEAGHAMDKYNAAKVAWGDAINRSNAADKAASDALSRLSTVIWCVDVQAKSMNPRMLDRKVLLDTGAGKPIRRGIGAFHWVIDY